MDQGTTAKTRVAYILDKSGSMASCREQAIKGTNDYMDALKQEDPETRVSVTLFDTEVYHLMCGVPVREMTPLTSDSYLPDGCTALYDAVGSTIAAMESEVQDGDVVMVSIFTDGQENSSHEFSRAAIFDLIRKYEKKGWVFAYLGANQDAWAEAEAIGISRGSSVLFATRSADEAFAKAGRIQGRRLRNMQDSPDVPQGPLFSTGHIDDEPEPPEEPKSKWWVTRRKK